MRMLSRSRCGKASSNWKGDEVGYFALHVWVRKNKGKATKCVRCSSDYWVEWANIDGNYKRDTNDYISLCRKCHREHDYNDSKYTQLKNARSKIKVFKFMGETKVQAAKRLGGTASMIDRRLKMGWSLCEAFSKPARVFRWKNTTEPPK